MSRATSFVPTKGDFVRVGRLGGYYDLKYYRHCDHLIGNTRDIVTYVRRHGWPAERAHYLPNFVDEIRAAPRGSRDARHAGRTRRCCWRWAACIPTRPSTCCIDALARLPGAILWLAGEGDLRSALERAGQPARRRPGASASSAGARMSPRCWPPPTCSSAPRATSRSATWCWRPGRNAARWSPPRARALGADPAGRDGPAGADRRCRVPGRGDRPGGAQPPPGAASWRPPAARAYAAEFTEERGGGALSASSSPR